MPETYLFIPYTHTTTIEYIISKAATGAIICLDLEDSIGNLYNEAESSRLKAGQRTVLTNLLAAIQQQHVAIKLAVRINASATANQLLDIECLSNCSHIHSIIIPKVSSAGDIIHCRRALAAANVSYREVIPLIESPQAIANIDSIIQAGGVRKIGFGHCDYNESIQAFPFFHQDAPEYWKWVRRIIKKIRPYKLQFINSACLQLNNDELFTAMLSYLHFLSDGHFGQFALTANQAALCKNYSGMPAPMHAIKNRENLTVCKQDALAFIGAFEKENKGRPFTVTNGIFLSPHEYRMAKLFVAKHYTKEVHFTFVGGCFPVQDDILIEDIFHRQLKSRMEEQLQVNLQVNIIRYERFANCLEKINSHAFNNKVGHLVFHIRTEPFLRLIKLYYKYIDENGTQKHSANLPFLKLINPEKYDVLLFSRRYAFTDAENKNPLHKTLIDLNYMAGYLLGNYSHALKKYAALANNIALYCGQNNIQLTVIGPALRANTRLEKTISKHLEKYMKKRLGYLGEKYITGLLPHKHNGIAYFNHNGIHATENYHAFIADKLINRLKACL